MRTTFFSPGPFKIVDAPRRSVSDPKPSLTEVARALQSLHVTLDLAGQVEVPDLRTFGLTILRFDTGEREQLEEEAAELGLGGGMLFGLGSPQWNSEIAEHYRVVSIEMRSPLTIVIEIPAYAYPGLVPGLFLLAHQISRLLPRISAGRAQDFARKAEADRDSAKADMERTVFEAAQRELIAREARAEAFAAVIRREYPTPDVMDFFGPDEDLDATELEPLPKPETLGG